MPMLVTFATCSVALAAEPSHPITIERADPAFFELTVVEMRFSPGQPRIDVDETARTIRRVLSKMGFNVHDYRLKLRDRYGVPYEVDMSPVAEEQREQSNSGSALRHFKKHIQESHAVPGFGYEAGFKQDMGEMVIGVTAEWPSGKHHGSVTMAVGSDWFRTFCTVKGFGVCSDREDCLGHEIGHFFGLEHQRHDWWGWSPKRKHIKYIRGLASCTHVDAWQEEREEGWMNGATEPSDSTAPLSAGPAVHHDLIE